jgi:hypothetical protein
VTTPQLNCWILATETNHKQIFKVFFISDSLHNYIRLFRLIDEEHIQLFRIANNCLWIWHFADFTLKFREIILIDDAMRLSMYFTLNPTTQTVHMHIRAWTTAITCRHQKIFIVLLLHQTNFALTFMSFVSYVHLKFRLKTNRTINVTMNCLNCLLISIFENTVFESAEFNYIA